MRAHRYSRIEVPAETEEEWNNMVSTHAAYSPFTEKSYFFGSNVPGKPVRLLLNPAGRPKLLEMKTDTVESDYKGFLS
jgi:hypothetical protein